MEVITNNDSLAADALEHLKTVYDPELGVNVVDLGLIYQLQFDVQQRKIEVEMTLTTRFCPMGEAITTGVEQCLEMTFIGYVVEINLVFDPPWSHENISEEGRLQLGH